MKCLICNQNEGRESWALWPNDEPALKFNLTERFRVKDCFCFECFNNSTCSALALYLADYYLSQQTEQPKKHYYKWHPASECVKVSQHFSSNLGQALQYIWRSETINPNAVTKGQSIAEIVKDLEKARAFIQFEIDRLRGN